MFVLCFTGNIGMARVNPMLVLNTVTFSGATITGNFSVDKADIDSEAGEDTYSITVKRHSDGVTVHNSLFGTTVNSGTGIFTGNTSTPYSVSGVYDITVVPTEGGDTVNTTSNSLPLTIGVSTMAAPSEPTVTPVDAPTQSQRPYKYTMPYKSQNSHNMRLVGVGVTKDLAFADLGAKAKVTGSSATSPVKGLTLSVTQAISDAPTLGGTGPTADAIIVCHRASDDSTINVQIPDMLLTYKVGTTYFIDVTNSDIIAVATAQTDKYGNGGFSPLPTSRYEA